MFNTEENGSLIYSCIKLYFYHSSFILLQLGALNKNKVEIICISTLPFLVTQ